MNIGKDNRCIWCDYIPEGKEKSGFIKVDISTEEVIQMDASPYEVETSLYWYSHHAKLRLIELKNEVVLPENTYAIWY